MTRAFAFLGFALLATGCGKSDVPKADSAAPAQASGKPATDEAKACITDYLAQCGWKDVEFVAVADQATLPEAAKAIGEAWAFCFSVRYSNVFGERQSCDNWVAVVARDGGKSRVTSCFDDAKQLVAGHSGQEESSETTDIVAPRP